MLGFKELIIIGVIIILIFGTSKLKNLGGDLGGAIKGFKKAVKEGNEESIEEAIKEPSEITEKKPSQKEKTEAKG